MPVEIGRTIDEFEVGMERTYRRTFTAEDVDRFAETTGDHNYFHVNEEAAQNSVFGRRIVQGLLVTSMATHMGAMVFPGPGFIAAQIDTRYLKPVYIGDTLICTITVTSVDHEREWLTFDAHWTNQHGERVAEGSASGRPSRVVYEPSGEGGD